MLNFNATLRSAGNVTIVDISGHITFTEAAALHELFASLIDRGQTKILLNLAQATTVDSSGIGELVRAYSALKKKGGDLKLLYLTPRIRDVLEVVRLASVLEDFPDEQSALRSFH